MRSFRVPNFTGIEAHRDDSDRGGLAVVENCLPFGSGGLRSGFHWEDVGSVAKASKTDSNYVVALDDSEGNSILAVSRNNEIHDIAFFNSVETGSTFDSYYDVYIPPSTDFQTSKAVITPIGNNVLAIGEGGSPAIYAGQGPPDLEGVPNRSKLSIYSQDWSNFPNCKFFTQGPNKTIFAAGNKDKPLRVYISEPAGLTSAIHLNPYSTEDTTEFSGLLSSVDILNSDAKEITGLSRKGNQVVVHTDKGAHLLYEPSIDQAGTGYRVEQAPATNFSSAVCSQVVSGEQGSLTYWLGFDGQVYKDESASRGPEETKSYADPDQANWKSKGAWEHELPQSLKESFAAFDPQLGLYVFFVESNESINFDEKPNPVLAFEAKPLKSWVYEKPQEGPTFMDVDFLVPEQGASSFNARVLSPFRGPPTLSYFVKTESGPENLVSMLLAPELSPNNFQLDELPLLGPTSFNHSVVLPQTGPTSLSHDLAPDFGPTAFTKEILIPTQEIEHLTFMILPSAGPSNLDYDYAYPSDGPTNFNAIQSLIFSKRYVCINGECVVDYGGSHPTLQSCLDRCN